MTADTLGIVEARNKLGVLVSRAVHAHKPTTITRSDEEHAVLISAEEYEELLQLRHERELRTVTAAIAAHQEGESEMVSYDSRDALFADLGLADGDRP